MTNRDVAVAAKVIAAQARADALPGAQHRCHKCGKPAAACAETACLTRCPEHPDDVPLMPFRGRLRCIRCRCSYEVQTRAAVLGALLEGQ